jgi:hypothetical protein
MDVLLGPVKMGRSKVYKNALLHKPAKMGQLLPLKERLN